VSVAYSHSALADLAAILAYVDARSPAGRRSVMRSIRDAVKLIGEYPRRGRFVDEPNVRVVQAGRYPYLIYWTTEGDAATIVHIRHAARKSPSMSR
jgi:plasmid stabilization system protein ParE